jgi:hypothetical protein
LHIKFSTTSDWIRSRLARRATLATSESAKNASSQGAFGHKEKEASVEQSLVVSTADVTSPTFGGGMTTTPEVEKGGPSTALPVGGHQNDLCVSALPLPKASRLQKWATPELKVTITDAYTPGLRGRMTSSPTTATSTSSKRRHERSCEHSR